MPAFSCLSSFAHITSSVQLVQSLNGKCPYYDAHTMFVGITNWKKKSILFIAKCHDAPVLVGLMFYQHGPEHYEVGAVHCIN